MGYLKVPPELIFNNQNRKNRNIIKCNHSIKEISFYHKITTKIHKILMNFDALVLVLQANDDDDS